MDRMLRDLRFAARQLTRSPGFTVLSVMMVGLGIAATTTIFTLVNTVFLRPPALVRAPDQIVAVYTSDFSGPRYGFTSYLDYLDHRAGTKGLMQLAGYTPRPFSIATRSGERADLRPSW